MAWGVNFPAHLVIIKGTEYFDGKQNKYVDFPITGKTFYSYQSRKYKHAKVCPNFLPIIDVLQMMGRAGRPQFDQEGKALIFVHDQKKQFYKKFLYDPFPVESKFKIF